MNVYQINDLSNQNVINVLKTISRSMFNNQELSENYLYEFKDKPGNLFFILGNGRYKNGKYFVITDEENKFVASAGWNEYNLNTALLLTRMLVAPEYRTSYVLGLNVLPIMINQVTKYPNVWMTVNEYNKGLYNRFVRKHEGKSTGLYSNWPEIYNQFEPIGVRKVYNTKQYVVQLKR